MKFYVSKYLLIAFKSVLKFSTGFINTRICKNRPSDKGGGGVAGHPDPEMGGGEGGFGGRAKIFFRPFGPQFGLKIRGGPWPLGPLP